MYRAEQAALVQDANQMILAIRKMELDYYIHFYTLMAYQSTIVGSFNAQALANVNAPFFKNYNFTKQVFFIGSAISLGCSITCMLMSTFAFIQGGNLALSGPPGSVKRAVKGLQAERGSTLFFFCASLLSLCVAAIGMYHIFMYQNVAYTCSFITALSCYFCYYDGVRIRNKFQFQKYGEDDCFSRDSSASVRIGELRKDIKVELDAIQLEGFLSKRGYAKLHGTKDPWARRYFVLKGHNLRYFKSKSDYISNPDEAIKMRPIDLRGYRLGMNIEREENKDETYQYCLLLSPLGDSDTGKRVWEFVCETEREFLDWKGAINKVMKILQTHGILEGADGDYIVIK